MSGREASQERVESEGFYEMLWDCEFCGTKGLLGKSQRFCAECGAPEKAEKRYFPSPEEQKKVEGHVYEGADRNCPACNAPMGAKAKNCTRCGAPMDGSKEVRGVAAAPPPAKKHRRIWPYIVGGIVVVIVAIWWLFIRTHEARLAITAHHWKRTIAIEDFRDQQQSAWRDQVPADASLPTCMRKERSTRQIPDGEDCRTERHDKKDGTFEQVRKCTPKYRSESVNDDWCTFTVKRWVKVDEATASGDGTDARWPDPPPLAGQRRLGARDETLELELGGERCSVGDATWRKYKDGDTAKVEVRARSGAVVCDSL